MRYFLLNLHQIFDRPRIVGIPAKTVADRVGPGFKPEFGFLLDIHPPERIDQIMGGVGCLLSQRIDPSSPRRRGTRDPSADDYYVNFLCHTKLDSREGMAGIMRGSLVAVNMGQSKEEPGGSEVGR